MKVVLIVLFSWVSCSVFAQVGRYEDPVDSIPIGGETQKIKQTQMEAQDELTSQLIAVRDSLKNLPSGSLTADKRKELDETIEGLRQHDQAPELMKRAYTLLNELRGELESASPAVRDRMRKD